MINVFDKEDIDKIALETDCKLIYYNEIIHLSVYQKEKVVILVFLNASTVCTLMKHPRKGKTELIREKVTLDLLRNIFNFPRVHTGKGYYEKHYLSKYLKTLDPKQLIAYILS